MNRRGLLLAGIFMGLPISTSAYEAWTESLREAQIEVLMSGNAAKFEQYAAVMHSSTAHLVLEWTGIAAQRIRTQDVSISREGAVLLSNFIYNGAERSNVDRSPGFSTSNELDPRQNLLRFVDELIEISVTKGRVIGEPAFSAALSLCPLWPFC